MHLAIALTATVIVLFSIAGAGVVDAWPLSAPAAAFSAFGAPAPAADGLRVAANVPVAQPAPVTAVLPIASYAEHRTFKAFGTYVDDGRFLGWHVGDDIEFVEETTEVPVRAIADGTVLYAGRASGYGGLIVVAHEVEGERVSAIYGHLDIASSALRAGSRVTQGQFLANLGDGESEETDGRRKHLHFGIYPGHELRTAGYVKRDAMAEWIDPQVFFLRHGLVLPVPETSYTVAAEKTR